MRAQYTMSSAAVAAIAFRAEALGLRPGMLVEHVMMAWLSKNEAIVLKLDTRLHAEVMKEPLFQPLPPASAPLATPAAVDPNSPFKHGAPVLPPEAFMTPSGKRRVDRVNFKMPICAECTMDVKEEEIGPGDMHIGCPGRT